MLYANICRESKFLNDLLSQYLLYHQILFVKLTTFSVNRTHVKFKMYTNKISVKKYYYLF
jgi:hypothetical protein